MRHGLPMRAAVGEPRKRRLPWLPLRRPTVFRIRTSMPTYLARPRRILPVMSGSAAVASSFLTDHPGESAALPLGLGDADGAGRTPGGIDFGLAIPAAIARQLDGNAARLDIASFI